ncbi:uncharacterized protein LOC126307739 [Schistocerca gregaria]|uniref:uncharacterized protein LOC126307739 n=1 Tax=Schistocerca gregaria TaxID=7010 RepID=UPI00211E3235|nr:uncharacterized protein LOC126307739 [Schistocerca gregaria]
MTRHFRFSGLRVGSSKHLVEVLEYARTASLCFWKAARVVCLCSDSSRGLARCGNTSDRAVLKMWAVAGGSSPLRTALPETRSTMSDARRVLLFVAAAAAVATGLPLVVPAPGFGWVLPHPAHIAGRPPLPPPPLAPHSVFILVHGNPAHVPCLQTGASPVQTGIAAGSHSAVDKNRQTESVTTMATTRAAVSPTAAADATTRQQGLLSFINVPDIPCPEGQRRDPAGNCRDEW